MIRDSIEVRSAPRGPIPGRSYQPHAFLVSCCHAVPPREDKRLVHLGIVAMGPLLSDPEAFAGGDIYLWRGGLVWVLFFTVYH